MLEIMGLGSQVLLALDFEQTYWRTFLSNAVLFDGVTDFLEELRLLEIPVAIITDLTAQIQFRKVVYFGLDHYFDYIVTSEEAGFDKPHSAPFELAVKKMEVKSERVWMIGDNPINDIQGAREAINAITIQKYHNDAAPIDIGQGKPDCVFEDFSKLTELLDGISSNLHQ